MTKEFENKIREIYDYIHSYGIKNCGLKINSQKDLNSMKEDKDKRSIFVRFVHKGFRKGQDLLITELINIEKEIRNKNIQIKEFNIKGEKSTINNLKIDIKVLKYKEAILRNLADSIAWQLMNRQYWIARRFHSGSKNRPSLLYSNIESLDIVAKKFYKQHPDGFALYSDITSFIDISDLITMTEKNVMRPVEVKEGKKSTEVLSFIDQLYETEDFKPENMGLQEMEKPLKFLDHVDRTLKQITKASRLSKLLKDEEGPDPFTGQQTYIHEMEEPLRYYHETLYNMFKVLEKQIWSYQIVENIICIGMFRNEILKISNEIFEGAISMKFSEEFPIVSYNQQLYLPIKEPIFHNPIGIDNMMDIIFGRVKILISVDFNALFELFNLNGFEIRWLSRKETQKFKDNNHRPFEFEKKAIYIKFNGEETILGDTFLSRLMYDNMYPSSLIEMYKEMNKSDSSIRD